jgi:molybdopterin converting factor small subunit
MSHTPDENLKPIFAATPDCLETSELESMLEDEKRTGGNRAEGWAHVQHCAHCQGEIELLRSFLTEQVTVEEQPHIDAIVRDLRKNSPAKHSPWWKTLLTPWALTPALAAVAVAVVVFVNIGHQRPGDVVLKPGDQVVRSQAIRVVAPVGDLNGVPEVLTWNAASGAFSYRVMVFEVDRTLLWTTSATSTQVAIARDLSTKIVPGKTLLWQIEALDASGSVIAASGLTQFRVVVN